MFLSLRLHGAQGDSMNWFIAFRREWPKHVFLLLLFLILAMIVTTVISKAYQFWDVGSNSWLDRFKGEGWEFQRGAAAMPQQDQFGDQFSSIKYLDQGWKPADSMWFYNTTQGSDLLPYDFFMVLEKPGTTELFRTNDNLESYHYLIQKPTLSDPDGLPVGFVKDTYKGKDYLGFACAACHTAQINYQGVGIRIDGGPAGSDMDSFLKNLAKALWTTRTDAALQQQFVKRVMDRGNYRDEKQVIDDLQKYALRLEEYNINNHSEDKYGYSRLDAFGRIYNRVLEHVATQKEIKEILDKIVADWQSRGNTTLDRQDIDGILKQENGKILTDNERDHLILRLAQALPNRALIALSLELFPRPDAPVSYPFLWDIPQHDYVQWNGLAPNAGEGPIGRNAGEAIGVFATLDWQEKPGFSIWSLIGGQGFRATHISFDSSVNVQNLRLIENRLKLLESPQWPVEVFGAIDEGKKARGELLFIKHCEQCHARIKRDDPKRRVVAFMSKFDEVQTDKSMASNAASREGYSGILRNQYVDAGPGKMLLNEKAPAGALLAKATLNVVATPEHNKWLGRRIYQWAYNLVAEIFSNEIKPSMKSGHYDPDTTAEPFASLSSYKARSLNGIWATAPYLHNGSVPSLYELLLPKRGPKDPKTGGLFRPDKFMVGSREFDPVNVGFKSSGYNGFEFDTSHRANSNDGHLWGTDLSDQDRWDLVEYLKSL
jgi:hypothetical protein